jgi:uncharacterized membrane protein YhhN
MDPLLLTALIAGASYCLPAWLGWGGGLVLMWKGSGVALLALWVWQRTGRLDLSSVLVLGALGDLLLGISLTLGAVAFLIGHLVAAMNYLRHRVRPAWLTVVVVAATATSGYALSGAPVVALYGASLGLMAGSAIASNLPQRIAVGALLFVLSDLLIFARFGPLAKSIVPTALVWPLYFTGQTLIASGLIKSSDASGEPRPRRTPAKTVTDPVR